MLTLFNLSNGAEKGINPSDLSKLRRTKLWIDLKDPTTDEVSAVNERFGLHLQTGPVLRKYCDVQFTEKAFVVFTCTSLTNQMNPKRVTPITIAFNDQCVITVRSGEASVVDIAKHRLSKVTGESPSFVAYAILEEIVQTYYDYIERVEGETAGLEEKLLERPSEETLKEIFRMKSRLISFNKMLWYQRGGVFIMKNAEERCISRRVRVYLDDIHDDITRQIDIVETFREILSDAIGAYLSTVSNKISFSVKSLTAIMLYLTVITTVTTFPNTVATIFGIPVIGSSIDVRVVLLLLLISTIFPAYWLLRKKWLRTE